MVKEILNKELTSETGISTGCYLVLKTVRQMSVQEYTNILFDLRNRINDYYFRYWRKHNNERIVFYHFIHEKKNNIHSHCFLKLPKRHTLFNNKNNWPYKNELKEFHSDYFDVVYQMNKIYHSLDDRKNKKYQIYLGQLTKDSFPTYVNYCSRYCINEESTDRLFVPM